MTPEIIAKLKELGFEIIETHEGFYSLTQHRKPMFFKNDPRSAHEDEEECWQDAVMWCLNNMKVGSWYIALWA